MDTGWKAHIPTPSEWEADFAKAQGRFGEAISAIFGDMVSNDVAGNDASLKEKITKAVKAALDSVKKPTKTLKGIYDVFKGACTKIKNLITSSVANKPELIMATCNLAIKGAKLAAKKAVVTLGATARKLGVGIAVVASTAFVVAKDISQHIEEENDDFLDFDLF